MRPYFSFRVRLSRQNIFLRDNHECQYCGKKVSEKKLTVDHVVPLSRGGRHEWENVVAACSSCNNRKGNKALEKTEMRLKRPPHRPQWLPIREFDFATGHLPLAWKIYLTGFAAAE